MTVAATSWGIGSPRRGDSRTPRPGDAAFPPGRTGKDAVVASTTPVRLPPR
jgi:hypothetical protein